MIDSPNNQIIPKVTNIFPYIKSIKSSYKTKEEIIREQYLIFSRKEFFPIIIDSNNKNKVTQDKVLTLLKRALEGDLESCKKANIKFLKEDENVKCPGSPEFKKRLIHICIASSSNKVPTDEMDYPYLLKCAAIVGNKPLVKSIIEKMKKDGLDDNSFTYATFFAYVNEHDDVLELIKREKEIKLGYGVSYSSKQSNEIQVETLNFPIQYGIMLGQYKHLSNLISQADLNNQTDLICSLIKSIKENEFYAYAKLPKTLGETLGDWLIVAASKGNFNIVKLIMESAASAEIDLKSLNQAYKNASEKAYSYNNYYDSLEYYHIVAHQKYQECPYNNIRDYLLEKNDKIDTQLLDDCEPLVIQWKTSTQVKRKNPNDLEINEITSEEDKIAKKYKKDNN